MADQLNMAGLNLGQDGGPRSYIPPHMRGKMGPGGPGANGPAPGPVPMNGPPPMAGGPPPPAAMNGLNNSAWAG